MASRVRWKSHARFRGGEKAEITSKPYLFLSRVLAKYLSLALTKIDFKGMEDKKHFGDLTVHIEQDNPSFDFYDKIYDDSEYDLAVPC